MASSARWIVNRNHANRMSSGQAADEDSSTAGSDPATDKENTTTEPSYDFPTVDDETWSRVVEKTYGKSGGPSAVSQSTRRDTSPKGESSIYDNPDDYADEHYEDYMDSEGLDEDEAWNEAYEDYEDGFYDE